MFVDGEGTFVKAIASTSQNRVNLVLVNYDQSDKNSEAVPITFYNLEPGLYTMNTVYVDGKTITVSHISIPLGGNLQRNIIMAPNMVVAVELSKE